MFRMMNLQTATLSLCRRSTSSSVNILSPCTRRMWSQMLILQIALSFCIKRFWQALRRNIFTAIMPCPTGLCSAFFKTDSFMPGSKIFDALKKDGFRLEHIRCLQRNPTGEIFITFHMSELCDTFLSKSSFVTPGCSYAPNDSERPLTFLTVYDAPYELPETAIIHRLSPYREAVWHHWGTYKNQDGVFNGLQHFRVRIQFAVPSYLCFGKFLLRLYHDGQTRTCRCCNRSGRNAADCRKSVSFNCDALGHMARECIRPMYCCICKSGQHLARTCPFSWHRE